MHLISNRKVVPIFVLFVVFILTFLFSRESFSNSYEKQIIVVFRYDDYSARSSTDLEVALLELFRKHNLSCTFGVIPFACEYNYEDSRPQNILPLAKVKIDILKDAIKEGVLEVALHGYSHQTVSKRIYSEFSSLGYDEQFKRINLGRKYLEEVLGGRKVSTFIPPWHQYDLNTLRALEESGFRAISSNRRGMVKARSSLKFLPKTCGILQVRNAVERARQFSFAQPVVVVLFHSYDFIENSVENGRIKYRDFDEILSWVSAQKDVSVMTVDQAINEIPGFDAKQFKMQGIVNFLPASLNKLWPREFWFYPRIPFGLYIKYLAAVSLFYALIVLFVGVVGFLLTQVLQRVILVLRYAGIISLIYILVYLFHQSYISPKLAIVAAAIFGWFLGIEAGCLKRKKR